MEQQTCYFCHAAGFEQLSDRIRHDEAIPVLRCLNCGLIFLDKTKPEFTIETYQSEEYLNKNPQLYGTESLGDYDRARMETYRSKAGKVLSLLKPEAAVLDIGCGCGSFLSLIKPSVKKVVGIELNKPLADYAREKLKIEIYDQPLESTELSQKFDAILMLQVIDHLMDPIAALKKAKTYLKDDGFIWVEVPNTDEALMRYLPENTLAQHRLFHYHRAHLWYFNIDTIKQLFALAGLNCEIKNVHDWTFPNFLQWWYLGRPTVGIGPAQLGIHLYQPPTNQYMRDMNELFEKNDVAFRGILEKHNLGSTFLCKATLQNK